MKKKLWKLAVCLLAASLALTSVALAKSVFASGGDSYIRSSPGVNGTRLALLPEGSYADYLGDSSVDGRGVTWYRISYRGTTGWVSSRYTSFSGDGPGTVYASDGDSYIRSSPDLSGSRISLLPQYEYAEYLGESSVDYRGVAWYRISYAGTIGWVSSRYTALELYGSVCATGGSSYIRSSPNLNGSALASLPDGAVADYLGDSSVDGRGVTWYRISYRGTTGWVSSRYTTLL